ncbi:MAG: 50S ribosome-binding GTPase [Planctomycetes bacterium]|nr:50S ribosome-binding GTPase [Planctomycetota bacterium]
MSDQANLFCLLSPPGAGAIATFALRGPRVWSVIRERFAPLSPAVNLPETPDVGSVWPGRLGEDARDDVVLAVKASDPAPWLEVHCHGGAEVIRLLHDLFVSRSLRACTWQEFEANAGTPEWQIAAKEMLLQAPTVRTAAILLDQYHGAFWEALARIITSFEQKDACAFAHLERLARWTELGRHLVTPFRVGIAGAPNVGKSSLVNALAGYSRSIVSPTPGTTRDVVTASLAIDGWPVDVFDTAGLRQTGETLENEGMRLARSALDNADLVLWLLDGSASPVYAEKKWPRVLTVINKIDLPPAWNWDEIEACRLSAKTQEGLTALCQRIAATLVPEAPPPGEAMPFNSSWAERVEGAKAAAQSGDWEAACELLRWQA